MMNVHRLPLQIGVSILLTLAFEWEARSQAVPATPSKFATRSISGSGTTGSAAVGFTAPAKPQSTVRTTTHIGLGEARQWKSTDGKTLLGKLIAFEDIVVEIKIENGTKPVPAAPSAMPDKPTVIRNGKARLLIDNKPFEVPFERLSNEDQKLVEGIQTAVNARHKAQEKK